MTSPRPFPSKPEEFERDDRVAYSTAESKWILEDDDGTEWEYQLQTRSWVPAVSLEEDDEDDEGENGQRVAQSGSTNARAQQRNGSGGRQQKRSYDQTDSNDATSSQQTAKKSRPKKDSAPPVNTAVYITSLPLDVTVEEVNDTFKRYGIIAEEVDSGKPRIKLYTSENGEFKGDALVVYFKPESIRLAIQMLDETDFRPGEEGPNGKMRVTEADRSFKKQQDSRPKDADGAEGKKKGPSRDQKKIIQKTQKLNDKLADWSDYDDTSTLKQTSSRFDKVVVLKHMFSQQEIEDDPAAILDIKDDIREECNKLGEVTNVSLYDKELDGVVTVRFTTVEAANACVRMMAGRWFDNQQVIAYIADGSERFKRSDKKKAATVDDDEGFGDVSDEEQRMERFGEYLEGN